MGNIVKLPDGNMHSGKRPSKRLEVALRSFIVQHDGSFYDDETDNGVYKTYFRLKNDICVEQAVTVGSSDYVCHTTLSCHTASENQNMLTALCVLANVLNCELDYGNFEVDCHTGDIRYRTYLEPGDVIYNEDLDKLLGYPLRMIEKYGEGFLDVLQGGHLGE